MILKRFKGIWQFVRSVIVTEAASNGALHSFGIVQIAIFLSAHFRTLSYKKRGSSMANINRRTSKRAIGVVLILGSMLIALSYSTIGNPQPAKAVNSQSDTYLKHTPGGTAQLLWDQNSTLTVTIDMAGEVAQKDIHPASINKGSCEKGDDGVLYPLSPVQAEQSSPPSVPGVQQGSNLPNAPVTVNMASKTIIPQVQTGIPTSGWFLNVYNGPTLSPPTQNIPIACADITNLNTSTNASQFVSLNLGPSKGPNQAANGTVTTTLYNNQLVLAITASGLAPNSTHQAEIHQGQCSSQGPVVHTLPPIVANGGGIGTSTTTISGITSIPNNWYVMAHLGATKADMGTQSGFDPIVCGDVGSPPSARPIVSHLQSQLNSQSDTYLKHSPSGNAQLLWGKKSTLTVTIDMTGQVASGNTYPARISKGSCETGSTGVLYPLSPVKAQRPSSPSPSAGVSMESKTIIPLVQNGIPTSGWVLNVYNGPTLSSPNENIPIACADITNFNTSTRASQSVSLVLGPTKGSNQAANGVATTTLYNNQYVIEITMNGLAPNSTHQADIRQGRCNSQGPVVHTLTSVVTDGSGNGTSTTSISGITSVPNNWYINVHLGSTKTDMNTQTSSDPFACGEISIG